MQLNPANDACYEWRQWLEDHVSEVTDALWSRLNREACSGIFRRRWYIYYAPSTAGCYGGLMVLAEGEDPCEPFRLLWNESFSPGAMTRNQVRAWIRERASRAPILKPGKGTP